MSIKVNILSVKHMTIEGKSFTVLPAKSDSNVMFVYIVIRDL